MRPFQRNQGNEQSESAGNSEQEEAGQDQDEGVVGSGNAPSGSVRQSTNAARSASQRHQQSPQRQGEAADVVPEWNPSVDMFAENDDLLIKAALPRVGQEDVEITLSGGVLTLSGECAPERSATDYHLREIRRGPFKRSIALPTDSDPSKVKARFEDGMLRITIEGGARASEEISIES